MKFVEFTPNYQKWFKNIPKFKEPKVFREAEVPQSYNKSEIGKQTGALNKEDLTEYLDEPEVLIEKAKIVANILKESKYACCYTGAGISTSSEIRNLK